MSADRRLKALVAALLLGAAGVAEAAPRLDPVFGDYAVLQRDRPIRISGSADPGEQVTIALADQSRTVRADRSGRWIAELLPMIAGGPHRLTVTGAGGSSATATDLLVGDVWLCSGQSNMEWPVRRSLNGEAEAQNASDDQVRVMTIAQKTALAPQAAFVEAPTWAPLTPQSAAEFSAACWFMAGDLRKSPKVPFGLIDASWGGTRIRPWMDEAAARASGSGEDAQLLALYRRDPVAAARRFAEQWGEWWRQRSGDLADREPWNASDLLEWRSVPSIQPWEQWGVAEFADFNGLVWARRRFTLTAEEAKEGATLSLGVVDDLDQTWVNGVGVGSSYGWDNPREYRIAPGLLRAGENEIIVNIGDSWSFGGFHGPAERLKITLADGQVKPLGDGWDFSVVRSGIDEPPRAPWDTHAGLGTIYNAMVAPLGSVGLKGVAWYQGESDVGVPGYDRRLAALMSSWRRQFENAELPFLIVALAGFGKPSSVPVASDWAQLIDEQRRAAMADVNARLVVATDLGLQDDIHPPNKQEVGRRLALAARKLAYGEDDVAAGTMPVHAVRGTDSVDIGIADASGPLQSLSGAPIGFELCAETQDSCRYASATLSAAAPVVTVRLDGLPATRVRYGWSDFPILNVYDEAGLPVPPFEMPIRD